MLARELGVTRGGFYHQFADREALLEAVLDRWEQASTDDVLRRDTQAGGDVATRVRRAGALTFSPALLPVDLAVRDWARRDPAVAARLRRVDDRRMQHLRLLFGTFCPTEEEVEARSVLAFSLLVGTHLLAAGHGSRSRAEVVQLAADLLLRGA